MRRLPIVWMAVSISTLVATAAVARIAIPGRTDSWVNDYAGIIDADTKTYLEQLLSSIKQKTPEPIEVIIATFPELAGWDFSEFAREYGEKWREIKMDKRDNGAIIIVAVKEKRVAIGAGQNLKGILTDAIINDIIQRIVMPEFQKGEFSAGIKKAAERIVEILDAGNIPTDTPIAQRIIVLILLSIGIFGFRNLLLRKKKG